MASASVDELGPECTKNGINVSMLLSYVLKTSTESCVQHLPEVQTVTNELVLELIRFKDRHSQCTFRHFQEWMQHLFGKKWPTEAPTSQAISKSTERLMARLSKLKKLHSTVEKDGTISEFLKQEYVLPRLGLSKGRVLHFSPVKKPTCATLQTASPTQDDYIQMYKELKQKMYAVKRNANERLKCREKVIHQQKKQIHSQQEAIRKYEKKLKGTESQLSTLKTS